MSNENRCTHFLKTHPKKFIGLIVCVLVAIIALAATPTEYACDQLCDDNSDCCVVGGSLCRGDYCWCSPPGSFGGYCSSTEKASEKRKVGGTIVIVFAAILAITLGIWLGCVACRECRNYEPEWTPGTATDDGSSNRETLVVSTVKTSKDAKVGVMLKSGDEGEIIVSRINPVSPFVGTALSEGDTVISINGQATKGMDAGQVTQLIRDAETSVDIEVQKPKLPRVNAVVVDESFVASATKVSKDTKVGIVLSENDEGKIVVSSIKSTSIFHGSNLTEGDEVLSINGQGCGGKSPEEVSMMIKEVEGAVSIRAQTAV
mmetsp:Transcript_17278/g.26735  ORF Transcript_17278/g.26735 Transcript_17278/m.26735 type:complete len:317 (-) Transcript_17278:196-1146(-)|eukprot:CAMPEP_0195299432 /NCGR_PEP_ID=MMETSP0707-20130614/25547_1 /TAXON_ID=33640 /ORGANISM="Asterionellopsis glacialis, Strain CCMP134" /LENGTH=316 /DNA_ID=CAMNT_0040361843 /DNA_START=64 /DNA_END=1014 /DNA_ORIENTATION=+